MYELSRLTQMEHIHSGPIREYNRYDKSLDKSRGWVGEKFRKVRIETYNDISASGFQ